MIECNGIDIFNPIEQRMWRFVDAFSRVYGKEYKKQISKKLEDATYIFISDSDYDLMIQKLNERKVKEIKEKVYDYLFSFNIWNGEKGLKTFFHEKNFIEFMKTNPEKSEQLFLILQHKKLINDIDEFNEFIQNQDNYNKVILAINSALKEVEQIRKKIEEKYENYNKEFEDAKNIVNGIECKYIDYLQKLVLKSLKKICKKNNVEFSSEIEWKKNFLTNILICGKEKITKKAYFISDEDKRLYIEFFKLIGFEEKESFEEYFKDENFLEIIFDEEKNILKLKDEKVKEISKNDKFYTFAKAKIASTIPITHGDFQTYIENLYSFYYNLRNDRKMAYVQNYQMDGDVKGFCVCKNSLFLANHTLIHEMGHLIDGTAVYVKGKTCIFKNGLMLISQEKKERKTNFAMLNEIFNDYITTKVSTEFEKTGPDVGFCRNEPSAYAICFDLFSNFFEKYKNILIKWKTSNNYMEFINYFGFDNLQKLDKIADDLVQLGLSNQGGRRFQKELIKAKQKIALVSCTINTRIQNGISEDENTDDLILVAK